MAPVEGITDLPLWTVVRGVNYEKIIYLRDRFMHWQIHPNMAKSTIDLGAPNTKDFTTTVLADGGISLKLTEAETTALPLGTFNYDILVTVLDVTEVVAKGQITVIDYTPITKP